MINNNNFNEKFDNIFEDIFIKYGKNEDTLNIYIKINNLFEEFKTNSNDNIISELTYKTYIITENDIIKSCN
jgi:hypothetical protein|tara:strand:+ start:738 stop:953 length:216 start_codon:yes stop_codon:yes gene_type:complete